MRPQLVQFYNRTKGGVDTIDKMHNQYTTAHISRCWPLPVFFAMLDIGGINATVLYWLNKDKEVTRCTYLRNVARSLVVEHVQHCLTIDQTPVEIKRQIPKVFGVDAPDRKQEYRHGRYYFCGTTRN